MARLKPLVFAAALAPVAWLVWAGFNDGFGANPIETITLHTGTWTLRFLVVTLAITPLRRWTGRNELIRFRRMLGLFAFFYGFLHLTTYVWLDQFFLWREMLVDIAKRPFITVGMAAFLLLVPLALTSTQGWIRRLGGRRWRQLHWLIYASAVLGVVHYWWKVKADVSRPVIYGVVVVVLLGARVVHRRWAVGSGQSADRSDRSETSGR